MKLIGCALAVALTCAAGLSAQSATVKERTKMKVKDGKTMTVDGCLRSSRDGGYVLTDRSGAFRYTLITDDDLSKHVGEYVEVTGEATVRDGKLQVEHEVGTSGGKKQKDKTEVKGDPSFIGVKSMRMIESSCK